MTHVSTRKSGFTIVELLIVIVVIAILAAISVVAYNGVQQRSRDSIRKADINAIAKALELNYIDYGAFTQPEARTLDESISGGSGWATDSDLMDLVTLKYMQSLPIDPTNNATYKYSYEPSNAGESGYANAGQAYTLCATLELGGNYCKSVAK